MRYKAFGIRNVKELLRDPLSYIFCLGFPVVMLIIMTFVNEGIPKEANMKIFQINYLAPGIAVFALSFTMLFTCLQVSKDRASTFLVRLYASPMKGIDFILGYIFPLSVIALAQIIITFVAAIMIGLLTGYTFSISSIFISIFALIPSIFLFIGLGMIFGCLFNEKAAPGLASILISVSAILGGVWMDVEALSSGWKRVCDIFPFYHGVQAARMAILGEYSDTVIPFIIVSIYALVIFFIAVFIFNRKMQSDLK